MKRAIIVLSGVLVCVCGYIYANTQSNNLSNFRNSFQMGSNMQAAINNNGQPIMSASVSAQMVTNAIASNPFGYLQFGAGSTNISFQLIMTNFIAGTVYTNQFNSLIEVSANATLNLASIAGRASLELRVPGVTTNIYAETTLLLGLGANKTNGISIFVPAGSTYQFINTSAGAGNSAGVVGGQILIL